MTSFPWTADQLAGFDAFCQFILDPAQSVFVLRGYSGTGKSTLVSRCVDHYPKLLNTLRLLSPNQKGEMELKLTATTNKAAEALSQATGQTATTIHSAIGLRVQTDYKTGKTTLTTRQTAEPIENTILFIDEASKIDANLLRYIFKCTHNCKIVFIGDPAQLLTVGCAKPPAFHSNFTEVRLNETVRQTSGSPITAMATQFRETVETGEWKGFTPDGYHIQHLSREDFEDEICREFARPDRHHADSRVLAWTNRTVIAYNKAIANLTSGTPQFQVNDYAVNNNFIASGRLSIKTDQMVLITRVGSAETCFGVAGKYYQIEGRASFFMPDDRQLARVALREAREQDDYVTMTVIQDKWIDLREAFACTIDKSQGSTYDRVFIDLDDLKRCPDSNQLARMLYVGTSRARHQVFFTGDLV
jgi:hypothetical protein